MTRTQIKNRIIAILEDIEPVALDDSDLHIPNEEIEKAAEAIMKLWDQGFVYDLPRGTRFDVI